MDDRAHLLETLKPEIRGILLSAGQNGVNLDDLEKDYIDLNGRPLPYRNLGYNNVASFLGHEMKDVCSFFQNSFGKIVLFPLSHESTKHIEKLIARQKVSKTSRFGGVLQQPPPHRPSRSLTRPPFSAGRPSFRGGYVPRYNAPRYNAPRPPFPRTASLADTRRVYENSSGLRPPRFAAAAATGRPLYRPPHAFQTQRPPMVARTPQMTATAPHFVPSTSFAQTQQHDVEDPTTSNGSDETPFSTPASMLESLMTSTRHPSISELTTMTQNVLNHSSSVDALLMAPMCRPTTETSPTDLKYKFLQAPVSNNTFLDRPQTTAVTNDFTRAPLQQNSDHTCSRGNDSSESLLIDFSQQDQYLPSTPIAEEKLHFGLYNSAPFPSLHTALPTFPSPIQSPQIDQPPAQVVQPFQPPVHVEEQQQPPSQPVQAPPKVNKQLLASLRKENPEMYANIQKNVEVLLKQYSRRGVKLILFPKAYAQKFNIPAGLIRNTFKVDWRELLMSFDHCFIDKNNTVRLKEAGPSSARSESSMTSAGEFGFFDQGPSTSDEPQRTNTNNRSPKSDLRNWINASHGDGPSSKETSPSVAPSNAQLERERIKLNLKKVLSLNLDGILPHQLVKAYSTVIGEQLNLDALNLFSVVELVDVFPDTIVQVEGSKLLRLSPACRDQLKPKDKEIEAFVNGFFVEILRRNPQGIYWSTVRRSYESQLNKPIPVQELEVIIYVRKNKIRQFYIDQSRPHASLWKLTDVVDVATLHDAYMNQNLRPAVSSSSNGADVQVSLVQAFMLQCCSMDLFYIQIMDRRDDLIQLMVDLNTEINSSDAKYTMTEENVKLSLPCAALYQSEGWHRVVITHIEDVENIMCTYVDYGTVSRVNLKQLRFLPKRFLRIPAQAIRCQLAYIKRINDKDYSVEALEKFEELTLNTPFWVRVEEKVDDVHHVILTLTTGEEDLHVNDYLVEHGYVESVQANDTECSHLLTEPLANRNLLDNNNDDLMSNDDFDFQKSSAENKASTSTTVTARSTADQDDVLDSEDEENFLNGVEEDSSKLLPELRMQIMLMRRARTKAVRSNYTFLVLNRTIMLVQRNKYVKEISSGKNASGLVDKINWLEKQISWLDERIKECSTNVV